MGVNGDPPPSQVRGSDRSQVFDDAWESEEALGEVIQSALLRRA